MVNSDQISRFLEELDPYTLDSYLVKCLDFLRHLTLNPACAYLKAETRVSLEVTLAQALSVSQLKYASATSFSAASMLLLQEVSINLLACRSVKEATSLSPLLPTLM